MPKAEKVRAAGAALFVNGLQLKGVQTLRTGTDITKDQILELSNAGVAQYVDTVPNVPITIDSNDYGSVDTLAAITDKIVTYTGTNSADANRTGRFLRSLGGSKPNSWTITEADLAACYCDLNYAIKTDDSTDLDRSVWIHRAALTGYTANYAIGGAATESFTLQADNKTVYLNAFKAIRVVPLKYCQVSTVAGRTQKFYFKASAAGNGAANASCIAITINDKIYRNGVELTYGSVRPFTLNATNPKGAYTASVSGILAADQASSANFDKCIAVVKCTANAWSSWYGLTSIASTQRAITKPYIKAWLFNTAGPAGETTATGVTQTLRLQTVAIDVGMTTDVLQQLGSFRSYGVIRQTPIPVNVTVTANDTDLDMYAKAMATSDSAAKQLYAELFSGSNVLVVQLFNSKTATAAANLCKTVRIQKMSITGETFNIGVGGIGTQELRFTADNISVIGNATNPLA